MSFVCVASVRPKTLIDYAGRTAGSVNVNACRIRPSVFFTFPTSTNGGTHGDTRNNAVLRKELFFPVHLTLGDSNALYTFELLHEIRGAVLTVSTTMLVYIYVLYHARVQFLNRVEYRNTIVTIDRNRLVHLHTFPYDYITRVL